MLVDVTPYFENTTMQASYNSSNVLIGYRVNPCEGYVLHSVSFDEPVIDEETGEETGEVILGFIDSYVGLGRNYDFEANPLQIYAVLASEVPPDRIFGVGNDHEIM